MRVLVTGAGGQLGHDVCRVLASRQIEIQSPSSRELDITDRNAVADAFRAGKPDALVHCAAWTAVDKAEDDPERVFSVNRDGTRYLAEACREAGAKMVYLSTDYVFPGAGDRFYETDDPTGPLNVYGRSKLAGELAVRQALDRYFIVRISWVFGKNGSNFVKTMLRLAESRDAVRVVRDQIGSPTYTADLAPLLCDMLETERFGVYHATNEGTCSWADYAREIFRLAGKRTAVEAILASEYPTPAARPANSRLSKASLDRAGFARLPDWRDALARYLAELSEKG